MKWARALLFAHGSAVVSFWKNITTVLTSEQLRAVEQADGEPVPIVGPENEVVYYLVPAERFQELNELLEDEKRRAATARRAKRNAVAAAL